MLKLYIRPVYLLCPEEEVASLSLLVESRREEVRTIKKTKIMEQIPLRRTCAPGISCWKNGYLMPKNLRLEEHGKPHLKKWGFLG